VSTDLYVAPFVGIVSRCAASLIVGLMSSRGPSRLVPVLEPASLSEGVPQPGSSGLSRWLVRAASINAVQGLAPPGSPSKTPLDLQHATRSELRPAVEASLGNGENVVVDVLPR
jgi:hypothetical protein